MFESCLQIAIIPTKLFHIVTIFSSHRLQVPGLTDGLTLNIEKERQI